MSSVTAPNGDTSESIPMPDGDTEWNDVTNILNSITSSMDLGEMLHLSDFSLHSAMSALEIGDGVLDAAMKERRLYIEDILNNKELISKMMSVNSDNKTLLGIFDELIKLLWSFFNGNSDQFSIYSCLYLYDEIRNHSLNTSNQILYLFIDSIKLCCGYAREIVLLSGIAEEEDWSKIKNFKLSQNFSNVNTIIKQLNNEINMLKNYMKLSENSTDKDEKNNDKNDNNNTYSKHKYIEAITHRFEFMLGLLNIMKEMYNVSIMLPLDEEFKNDISVNNKEKSPSKSSQENNKKSTNTNTNKKKSKTKEKLKQPQTRGKKNKGKTKGKNKGKQQRKSTPQNQPKKKSQTQKKNNKTNIRKENDNNNNNFEGECGMLLIDSGLVKNKCNLSKDILNKHKESVQNFKQLSSSLLRIVNHLIETCDYGDYINDNILLKQIFDDRIGNNKSVHAPRKQRIENRLNCFKLFNNWCKCIRFMCNICKLDSFDSFLSYLNAFSNGFNGCIDYQTNVIIRCFLTILIEQFAKYNTFLWSGKPLIHFLQISFNYLCEWSRIFVTTNKQYLGDYYTFFSRVETAIKDIVRQKLLDVSRQMDWTKRIIKNWQILETESPEIDRLTLLSYLSGFDEKYHEKINSMEEYKCCSSPYSSWIIDNCCNSMINYIFIHLNKDMKLYANYEIEYVYYYLEYLFRTQTQIYKNVSLKRYQKVNLEKLNELINPNYAKMKARKLKKNKNISNKNNSKDEYKLLPAFESSDKCFYLMSEAQRCLCLGIFELIQSFYQINCENNNILQWDGLSDRDYDEKNDIKRLGDESLRFEHRFNIFNHVDQPQPISYRQFRTIMYEYNQKYKTLNEKFEQTKIHFDLCCKNFGLLISNTNKFKNIMSFEEDYITAARKVAIINKIFTSKLEKIIQQNKNNKQFKIKIKHHFNKHSYYATFEIDNKIDNKNDNNNNAKQ